MKLLTTNTKLEKSVKGWMLTGLSLAPHKQGGRKNVCPHASKGCAKACLFSSGMAQAFPTINKARIAKTQFFFDNNEAFMKQLVKELASFERKAIKHKLKPAVRLNTISDVAWELHKVDGKTVFELFPNIQFYDYTKWESRAIAFGKGKMPENYHLTFSRSESNEKKVIKVLANGGNVAVVFSSKELPSKYLGFKVINGDENDARFLDKKNVIVGLVAKGDAKKDESGFVVNL